MINSMRLLNAKSAKYIEIHCDFESVDFQDVHVICTI